MNFQKELEKRGIEDIDQLNSALRTGTKNAIQKIQRNNERIEFLQKENEELLEILKKGLGL